MQWCDPEKYETHWFSPVIMSRRARAICDYDYAQSHLFTLVLFMVKNFTVKLQTFEELVNISAPCQIKFERGAAAAGSVPLSAATKADSEDVMNASTDARNAE